MRPVLAVLVLAASLCRAAPPPAAPRCVEIVGTADVHGHLAPEKVDAAGASVERGGLPAFGGYLNILRRKYPGAVVLLDGGDLFQGTLPSNLSKGAAVIAAYNTLGYTATAVGNHEFDFGPDAGAPGLTGALEKRMAEARFPFLAANLYDRATGKRPAWKNFAPSALVQAGGVKVGLIGAITVDTPNVTTPGNVVGLEFRDAAPEVLAEAKRLRAQGAELVVLTAHIGGGCGGDPKKLDDVSQCDASSELWRLLHALPKGTLDAVVAGHTHRYLTKYVDGVAVIESGSYSRSFGWVESCVGPKGVKTTLKLPTDVCVDTWAEGGCGARDKSAGVKPSKFLGEKIVPDAAVEKAAAPFLAKVKELEDEPVGVTLAAPLVRTHDAPSAIGHLIAEGLRRGVPGASIGVMNAGGIRADLVAGPMRYRQLFELLPFESRVVALRLTGRQVREFVLAPMKAGHGFSQVAGAHVTGGDVVLDDGKPLDDKAEYVLATNEFLADGGDGVRAVTSALAKDRKSYVERPMRDVVLDYLKSLPQPLRP